MSFQAAARRESLSTVAAGEGLFSGMDSHMLGEASPLGKRPQTLLASVWLLAGVRSHVFTKLVAKAEPSLAHGAGKRLLVRLDVFVEDGFACERLAALRAFVRLFDGVDSSLVKRTAPVVAEDLSAFGAREVALLLALSPPLAARDVHVVHVLSEALSVAVALPTGRTRISLLVRMHRHVLLHVARIRTRLATHWTLVDVIPSVNPLVFLEVRRAGKALVAYRTREGFLAAVS